jgi:anti-sigma factor RsiW
VTCREFADFIFDYLAGELPADSRARFERHLARCPHCPEYLRQYQLTVAASQAAFDDLDAPVPETVPEELVSAILAARKQ